MLLCYYVTILLYYYITILLLLCVFLQRAMFPFSNDDHTGHDRAPREL